MNFYQIHPKGYWWRIRSCRPHPTPGRDKSRLYALAIASLGLFRAIRQQYPKGWRAVNASALQLLQKPLTEEDSYVIMCIYT